MWLWHTIGGPTLTSERSQDCRKNVQITISTHISNPLPCSQKCISVVHTLIAMFVYNLCLSAKKKALIPFMPR